MKPFLENLLVRLFQTLRIVGSTENEYVMKAVMRTLLVTGEHLLPYIPTLVNELCQKLQAVCKVSCSSFNTESNNISNTILFCQNPTKPHFNHYLFESFSLCIRVTCQKDKTAVTSFEEALFGMFTNILMQDVTEFIPYVFQSKF